MIKITNLTKAYNRISVLEIPEFEFKSQRIYALIGANGSGKSTLLRIMSGTLTSNSGTVNGIDASSMGYLPQSSYAFAFSVQRNVEMALTKSKGKNRKQMAREALSLVGMLEHSEKKGNNLSGGEAQRMALARIIAAPRSLLILDEPTSSADIAGIDKIENALLEYKNRYGCTVIFSTHSPAQALRIADYTVFLDKGKIVESGETKKVIQSPESDAAKLFLQHWRI